MPGCSDKKDNPLRVSPDTPEVDPYAMERARITAAVDGIRTDVEQVRGKTFIRPVTPVIYSRSEYTDMVNSGLFGSSSMPADVQAVYNRIFIRQGFMRTGDDYFAESDAVYSTDVAGFYRDGSDSIVIIMPDSSWVMNLQDSVTVFHELIHALQDQYFGLTALKANINSSDEQFAFRYTVEGEAKLLDEYYAVTKIYDYEPPKSALESAFASYAVKINAYIDTRLSEGERAFIIQPFYWGYYSYGPLFISSNLSGTDWGSIDGIFENLPVSTAEVMHPRRYMDGDRSGSIVDISGLSSLLVNDFTWYDRDCLGEVLACTMLREWGVSNYLAAADGLRGDCEVIFGNAAGTDLAFYWFTAWESAAEAQEFAEAYRLLLNAKYGINMPAFSAGVSAFSGSVPVLVKSAGTRVCIMENHPPARQAELLAVLEAGTIADWGAVSAKTAAAAPVPFVSKERLGGINPRFHHKK